MNFNLIVPSENIKFPQKKCGIAVCSFWTTILVLNTNKILILFGAQIAA